MSPTGITTHSQLSAVQPEAGRTAECLFMSYRKCCNVQIIDSCTVVNAKKQQDVDLALEGLLGSTIIDTDAPACPAATMDPIRLTMEIKSLLASEGMCFTILK